MQDTQISKPLPAAPSASKAQIRNDWLQGYESQPKENQYWIDGIEGQIPPQLHGTLFRNGPGLLDINGQSLHHPIDGDGTICSVAFSGGRAHFRNRFVRTEGFLEEQKAGKILYRGAFGTQKPGGWLANAFDLKIKNVANTNIIYWGGKLLALWEAAPPYRLDAHTLETLGQDCLNGVLQSGDTFSAHPRIDPTCNMDAGAPCLVNFSYKPGLSTSITISEFNPDGKLLRRHTHSVPGFAFLHDMAITPNYCIFLQNPVSFNPLPYVLGWRGICECVRLAPNQPAKLILIPRTGRGQLQILETEPCFVWHHANAFEREDEIVLDSVCYDSMPALDPDKGFRQVDFDALPTGQLWRFRLDLTEKTVRHQVLESRYCEFPSLHPEKVGRPYRYLYTCAANQPTGHAPLQVILKIDLAAESRQVWSAAPRGFVGEPVFVPRPGGVTEDDGWLLLLMYDAAAHRSDVVILDARDLNKGPVARLHLKQHIPHGLHGCFTPEYFGPKL